jgi:hypothetical protein
MRLLILLLIFGIAQAETRIEVGPSYLSDESSDGYMVILSERMGKFDFGIGYVSEQDVWPTWEQENGHGPAHLDRNSFIYSQRYWTKGKFELAIGAAHFSNKNRALGQRTTWPVTLAWNLNKSASIRLRHFSNSGSATPNLGQDAITLGWTF